MLDAYRQPLNVISNFVIVTYSWLWFILYSSIEISKITIYEHQTGTLCKVENLARFEQFKRCGAIHDQC